MASKQHDTNKRWSKATPRVEVANTWNSTTQPYWATDWLLGISQTFLESQTQLDIIKAFWQSWAHELGISGAINLDLAMFNISSSVGFYPSAHQCLQIQTVKCKVQDTNMIHNKAFVAHHGIKGYLMISNIHMIYCTTKRNSQLHKFITAKPRHAQCISYSMIGFFDHVMVRQ